MQKQMVNRQQLILVERTRMFYSGLWLAGISTLLLSGFIFELNGGGSSWSVMVWEGCMLLVGLTQMGLWFAWRHISPRYLDSLRWQYFPLPVVVLSGLCWGAAAAYPLPDYSNDIALLTSLAAAAGVLLTVMLLAALELMMLLFFVSCLVPLFVAINVIGAWPHSTAMALLVASVIAIGLAAAMLSAQLGVIARLRAGKRNVSGKLDIVREEVTGLHHKLSHGNGIRRDVEHELYLAKEAAETANMVKSEFLATMSHEIRTPLNGIVPLLELLRETRLDNEQKQFVDTALNSSHQLLSIINDILDFSKIEAGKMELESVETKLGGLVEAIIATMSRSAERRGLLLDYKIDEKVPDFVRCDPVRLRQILTNLVSNAIKFTEKGGVKLEIALEKKTDEEMRLRFSVKDTGIGMSQEAQARIFRSFVQADASTTRKHGGTGLGLVISKQLVELMNGQIGVRSESGKGSVFWFVVPMHKSLRDAQPDESAITEKIDLSGLAGRILIVEDNPVNLNVARKMLQSLGLECVAVTNGMQALDAIEQRHIDLVLMDCQMPVMDGYDATRAIRLRESLRGVERLPVIAMTANAMPGDRQRCFAAGMDDYLSKPILPDLLNRMMHRWLPKLDMRDASGKVADGRMSDESANDSSSDSYVSAEILDNSSDSVIDSHVINELYEIMEDDFSDLLEIFLHTAPGLVSGISSGVREGDIQQVINAAHSLKSGSANLGALRLSEEARNLEYAARDGDLEIVTERAESVIEAFDRARHELQMIVDKGQP